MNESTTSIVSSSFILWNDFESSLSSAQRSPTPILLPVCQSTTKMNRVSTSDDECNVHAAMSESTSVKRRKILYQQHNSMLDNTSFDSLAFIDLNDNFDASPQSPMECTPSSSQWSSSQSSLSLLLSSACCELRCLASLRLLKVERCHKNFESRTSREQEQFLLDTLSLTISKSGQHSLTLCGRQLCKVAFLKVLGISEKRLQKVSRMYSEGAMLSQQKLRRKRCKSAKYSAPLAWMEHYFSRIGDI